MMTSEEWSIWQAWGVIVYTSPIGVVNGEQNIVEFSLAIDLKHSVYGPPVDFQQ